MGTIRKCLAEFLEDFKTQKTLKFAKPVACLKDSPVLVVPIVKVAPKERKYKLLDEVEEEVKVEDSGRIGVVTAKSSIAVPVLVRASSVLKGDTQPRVVRFSVVVEPLSTTSVVTACVHAPRPIRSRARFRLTYDAPIDLLCARLARAPQREVWRRVAEYAVRRRGIWAHYEPDLSKELELARREERIRAALDKFPLELENQVGVAVVGPEGVYAIELFDHPDSWKVAAKRLALRYADVVASKEGVSSDARVLEKLEEFLDKVAGYREEEVYRGERSYTRLIESEDIYGEYTVLDGEIVHFIAVSTREGLLGVDLLR